MGCSGARSTHGSARASSGCWSDRHRNSEEPGLSNAEDHLKSAVVRFCPELDALQSLMERLWWIATLTTTFLFGQKTLGDLEQRLQKNYCAN
mmetsp:Transcript_24420/g.96899  ORF Transcript_24420/g.96899 Transcript_24420/m.96899 type:complete len:92 (-) Transcript_24420:1762-2037(-)